MNNYTCRECGIQFNGEEKSISCPACGSEDIILTKDAVVPELKSSPFSVKTGYKTLKSRFLKPYWTTKPNTVSETVDYICNDCGKVFESHDSESSCPGCSSGYIVKGSEIRDKIIPREAPSETALESLYKTYTRVIIFLVLAQLIAGIFKNFYFFLFFSIAVIFFSFMFFTKKEGKKMSSKTLLIIRDHAAIWSAPVKNRTNITAIAGRGFQLKEKSIRIVGDILWYGVKYKGRTAYILSEDVLNISGLLMVDFFIVGEKPEVNIYETPSTMSAITDTLTRGFYLYKRKSYPEYFTDQSTYWAIEHEGFKWLEIYQGIKKTGYALKNNFFFYSMKSGAGLRYE